MMGYIQRKMAAKTKGEPFDEKMPMVWADATAGRTIADASFGSSAEVVSSLEGIFAMLTQGRTFEIQGKQHTTQFDHDGWLTGVGDRAAWAPKLSQLPVAAEGVVFHVTVRVADAATNQAKAIELARIIAAEP